MEILSFTNTMLLMMIMIATMGNMAKSDTTHLVGGGKFNWAPDINFTEWSLDQHFRVDDWLYFGYEGLVNVLEVNKTSYENCWDTYFIKNLTRGGESTYFHLTETKTYYFISGRGYCQQGIKVAIDVTEN